MPAILIWNIQHSSGFQDSFSEKNNLINEVLENCIRDQGVTAVILLEITSRESVEQFARNRQLDLTIHGDGSSLKYAVLTKGAHRCTDVTPYFPSFSDKPRGVVHVGFGSMPALLITHIKSDSGDSGLACLSDICKQLPENMHSNSQRWPQAGVIALADWNLEAKNAEIVANLFQAKIVAPSMPTRYSSIAVDKITSPKVGEKTLDYACVFGGLKYSPSISAMVPDIFYERSVGFIFEKYLDHIKGKRRILKQEIQKREDELKAALDSKKAGKNITNTTLKALQSALEVPQNEKIVYDVAKRTVRTLYERIGARARLTDTDQQAIHQLITQPGMGPDHLPVVIKW
ncbi:hypothetical protein ACQ86G_21795 [Roseateles chitinivorans]|uniref:hypothetical protein n=1 Tax=Roseateles chitinivorans TaxID=2917965 RepID=UPI003D673A02